MFDWNASGRCNNRILLFVMWSLIPDGLGFVKRKTLYVVVSPEDTPLIFFTMTPRERRDAEALILWLKDDDILKHDPSVVGFNLGINCGEAAGQTIMHAHVHLIPRRLGDTPNPRGGVRGVIPDKMAY